ncbi:heparinase II/III family protein [Spirulina subsalsa FACHB-351]|uniref:Heparinase II/III family protein n=1 Tax=Spirulina subsalsa FACHB-351 TaxID=234711 RepID=A0ABT3L934_9CYAN|nr:heparinase II/III family protein [Spirulina subsalsa]MCW6038010.1 heparinase II/III family protein [Spirulina subsalsa FACHB-351]
MNLGLWWRTIRDLPPQQITARIEFEIKRRSFPNLPLPLRHYWTFGRISPTPPLHINYLNNLQLNSKQSLSTGSFRENKCHSVTFTFLNQSRTLPLPITWNSSEYSRLWQFNLHYFDWIRDRITTAYQKRKITEESFLEIYSVITDWIDHNPFYSFDGWHPYTTSLRIVNWTYAIHTFPELKTEKILESLWKQINYLYHNKEYFAGGNHLLENLRALIIGGLNFNHPKTEKIVNTSIEELIQQLSYQILPDGGHYERSPMYHLIVMNLVAESTACLYSANLPIPTFILDSLSKMLEFAQGIRLHNGNYPLWNDAAYNITYSLDETINWTKQLLNSPSQNLQSYLLSSCNLLHLHLLNKNPDSHSSDCKNLKPDPNLIPENQKHTDDKKNSISYHAPHTGYSILRNSHGLELGFDYGLPCPPELPPHAHADCLTIDLYYQGQPIIIDTGTSEYKKGLIREYERSTKAHNTVEIADQNQSEVWGSFRVGRKAKPLNVTSGVFEKLQWMSASHNGYYHSPIQSIHHRWIGLEQTNVIILDVIATDQTQIAQSNRYGTARFHFAPNLDLIPDSSKDIYHYSSKDLSFWVQNFSSVQSNQTKWLNSQNSSSWHSPEFGQPISRGCLEIRIPLDQSYHALLTLVSLNNLPQVNWKHDASFFQLNLNQINLNWTINQSGLAFKALNQ